MDLEQDWYYTELSERQRRIIYLEEDYEKASFYPNDFENFYNDFPGGLNRKLFGLEVDMGNIGEELFRKLLYFRKMDEKILVLGENPTKISLMLNKFNSISNFRLYGVRGNDKMEDCVRGRIKNFIDWMYAQPFVQELYKELRREGFSHSYIVSGSE